MADPNVLVLENCELIESRISVLKKIEDARVKEKILSYEIEKESCVLKCNGLKEESLMMANKKLVQDCVSIYVLKTENSERIKENLLTNYEIEIMKKENFQHLKNLRSSFEVLHRLYHDTYCSTCNSPPLPCPSCNKLNNE